MLGDIYLQVVTTARSLSRVRHCRELQRIVKSICLDFTLGDPS